MKCDKTLGEKFLGKGQSEIENLVITHLDKNLLKLYIRWLCMKQHNIRYTPMCNSNGACDNERRSSILLRNFSIRQLSQCITVHRNLNLAAWPDFIIHRQANFVANGYVLFMCSWLYGYWLLVAIINRQTQMQICRVDFI